MLFGHTIEEEVHRASDERCRAVNAGYNLRGGREIRLSKS